MFELIVEAGGPEAEAVCHDAHGNTTTLGNQTLGYDGADRHTSTTTGATMLRYVRDATDRILERKLNGTTTARYGYAGGGDSSSFTLDANNAVIEATIGVTGPVPAVGRTTGLRLGVLVPQVVFSDTAVFDRPRDGRAYGVPR